MHFTWYTWHGRQYKITYGLPWITICCSYVWGVSPIIITSDIVTNGNFWRIPSWVKNTLFTMNCTLFHLILTFYALNTHSKPVLGRRWNLQHFHGVTLSSQFFFLTHAKKWRKVDINYFISSVNIDIPPQGMHPIVWKNANSQSNFYDNLEYAHVELPLISHVYIWGGPRKIHEKWKLYPYRIS